MIRLIFGGVGVLFGCIALGMKISARKKKKNCTKEVEAQVVDMERVSRRSIDGYRSAFWYPVYEYWTGEGYIRRRSLVGSSRPKYSVGQKVRLYVNPDKMEEFYCPENQGKLLISIFAGTAVLLVLISLGLGLFCHDWKPLLFSNQLNKFLLSFRLAQQAFFS